MTIQKNVASQRLHFLMVDATDFATPEPSINTTNQYCKDNGGWSTCSNTESEISSGLYRITLAATETNAQVVTFKFTGTGCADQFITIYPEDNYKAGISDILSTLDDMGFSHLSALLSTLDGPITAYLSDLNSGLDVAANKVTSILIDTTSLIPDVTSILGKTTSILVDTGTTIPATLSDLNSGLDVAADKITSILADTGTTLENRTVSIVDQVSQILADTGTTLENRTTSIVNQTSQIISSLGGAIAEMAQGIPTATPTIKQALMYLYMAWRNETNTTANLHSVKNDAGTVICKATLSDDATTFVKAEFVSGA